MTRRFIHRGLVSALLALGLMSPALAEDAGKSGPVPITVSVVPQQWLVDSIGGGHVKTTVMVKPGASPATYEPTPSQMQALTEAEIYFSIGVPFEHAWLPRFEGAAPDLKVIDMAERVERRVMGGGYGHHEEHEHEHEHEEAAHEHDHDHDAHAEEHHEDEHHDEGEEHEGHSHAAGSPDPHVWVSPLAMRAMASTVVDVLSKLRPEFAADFRGNYAKTVETINVVDAQAAHALAAVPQRTFMVFHPAWGYFADAYGLRQMAIETGGKEPSPQDMHRIIDEAREHDIKVIFVQAQFSQRAAKAIAEDIGGEVKPLDPLAYDWPENTRTIANTFAATLR